MGTVPNFGNSLGVPFDFLPQNFGRWQGPTNEGLVRKRM